MRAQLRPSFLVAASVLLGLALSAVAGDQPAVPVGAPGVQETRVVAYYFHGNVRCASCRKLEAYAEEAIAQGFADELATGRLELRAVNTDQPENAHFVKDFELTAKSVVLVCYRGDEVVRFENLTRVWQLLRDKDAFLGYVRDSTREFLAEG